MEDSVMLERFHVLLILLVFSGLVVTASHAQNWTAEQQEIIDLNQSCWDAWVTEDVAEMRRVCNEHKDATNWWTPNGAPTVGWFEKNGDRWTEAFLSRSKSVYFEIIPLAVSIFDNTAQIYFWATSTDEDNDGELTTTSRKQLNIWQKMDDRWTWIGGMAVLEADED
jgi:hypothetical protein